MCKIQEILRTIWHIVKCAIYFADIANPFKVNGKLLEIKRKELTYSERACVLTSINILCPYLKLRSYVVDTFSMYLAVLTKLNSESGPRG